jgi:hypothetical protein
MRSATLAMADRSDPARVIITVDPNQLSPRVDASFPLRQDLLIIHAPGLAAGVRNRAGVRFAYDSQVAEPALIIGLFLLADPEKHIPKDPLQNGKPPPWNEALRMTETIGHGYCRVWARSANADGLNCLEHSCQTAPGFSGAPTFLNRGTSEAPDWVIAGINVSSALASGTGNCGPFNHNPLGILGNVGAIGAVPPQNFNSGR